jgi:hypothetical protein
MKLLNELESASRRRCYVKKENPKKEMMRKMAKICAVGIATTLPGNVHQLCQFRRRV